MIVGRGEEFRVEMRLRVTPMEPPLMHEVPLPASAARMQRALILASVARGESWIETGDGCTPPAVHNTAEALKRLGASIVRRTDGYVVDGGDLWLRHPDQHIYLGDPDCGALPWILAMGARVQNGPVVFEPHPGRLAYPVTALVKALEAIGLHFSVDATSKSVRAFPGQPEGGAINLSPLLSRWVSSVLMVAPLARAPVTIKLADTFSAGADAIVTTQLLRRFGIFVDSDESRGWWRLDAPQTYRAAQVDACPDPWVAAFVLALTAAQPGTTEIVRGRHALPSLMERLVTILREMGVAISNNQDGGTIGVRNPGRLVGTTVDVDGMAQVVPLLMTLGATASGTTVLRSRQPLFNLPASIEFQRALRQMGAEVVPVPASGGRRLTVLGVDRLQGGDLPAMLDAHHFMGLLLAAITADRPSTLPPEWSFLATYSELTALIRAQGMKMKLETFSTASQPPEPVLSAATLRGASILPN